MQRSFNIAKASASISLDSSSLSQSWDGTSKSATATTSPTGLSYTVTYDGSSTAPSAVGSYAVVATITDPNYTGSTSNTMTIVDRSGPTTSSPSASPSPTNHPPAITATIDDSQTGNSTIQAAEVFLTTAGANGSGIAMSASGGSFGSSPTQSVTLTLSQSVFNSLPEGTNTVYIHGQDAAGNWGATTSTTFTVDKPPPATSYNSATNGPSSASVTLTATDPVPAGVDAVSGVAATYYTIDGGSQTTYAGPFTVSGPNHTLIYWSVDGAGNAETHHSVVVSTDHALSVADQGRTIAGGTGSILPGVYLGAFHDTDSTCELASFTGGGGASINWGNGSSPGTIAQVGAAGNCLFAVFGGSHLYSAAGKYTISVLVTDVGGATTTLTDTASIATGRVFRVIGNGDSCLTGGTGCVSSSPPAGSPATGNGWTYADGEAYGMPGQRAGAAASAIMQCTNEYADSTGGLHQDLGLVNTITGASPTISGAGSVSNGSSQTSITSTMNITGQSTNTIAGITLTDSGTASGTQTTDNTANHNIGRQLSGGFKITISGGILTRAWSNGTWSAWTLRLNSSITCFSGPANNALQDASPSLSQNYGADSGLGLYTGTTATYAASSQLPSLQPVWTSAS